MKAIARILATMAATALVSLALAGAALAADPTAMPTVGGTLSAAGKTITVLSSGNVPAHVHMTASDPAVTLSESDFDIQPGATHSLTFSGKAAGTVSARYSVLAGATSGESGSATLTLNLIPGKVIPPFDPTPWVLAGIISAALLLVVWRVKPWQYRLSRRAGTA